MILVMIYYVFLLLIGLLEKVYNERRALLLLITQRRIRQTSFDIPLRKLRFGKAVVLRLAARLLSFYEVGLA